MSTIVVVGDEIHVSVTPPATVQAQLVGVQGPQGPVGLTGPQGEQGIQGIQGEIGPQGPQGLQGVKGDTGDPGPAGAQGIQGEQGIQGPAGEQGPQGIQGPAGADGADGVDGINGSDGHSPVLTWSGDQVAIDGVVSGPHLTGPQGVKGDTGDAGPQGIQGETGAQGIQGVQGIQGEAGSQGPAGPGVAAGGTTGQVLAKNSNTDYDTEWVDPGAGSGDVVGPASSVADRIALFSGTSGKLLKDGEKVLADLVLVSALDTDGTLAANSDAKIATQKAVKTYVDAQVLTGIYNPFLAPASAHASDDEFDDASLSAAWTEWDAGSILTVSEEAYGLKLAAANASGVKYAGVSKALPSGDNLTIDAYMSIGGRLSNYVVVGLMVAEDIVTNPSTGKFSLISFQYGGADPFTIARALNYTNYTQNAGVWGTTLNRTVQSGMFLRIVKIGTAYYFLVSCDGIGYMVLHENQALGYTPTRVGLCINDEGNGGDCVAIARFIRFNTSADLFRPVSGRRR